MHQNFTRAFTLIIFLLLGSLQSYSYAQDPDLEESKNAIQGVMVTVQEKFNSLDNKGKFIVGSAVGFIGTRVLLGSAMTAIKTGAVAFITAEVLHHTGVLDVREAIDDIHDSDLVQKIKVNAGQMVGGFRTQVRRRLNPLNAQELFEKERMATLGAASGAVLACLL
eukprot:CAMPEP_0198150390 /NCGR_PEP_ID=MMETSP1443-20131203/50746_1 /TAXON_ID=186043 /ORGANISM="Entomoneis sp., Strain CCMP2396" /LENGTH=165 /DNA_ID=CAMNT_0043815675 /DNA_START=125 /DNA_END=622 /DNA_ORIENTATION=-